MSSGCSPSASTIMVTLTARRAPLGQPARLADEFPQAPLEGPEGGEVQPVVLLLEPMRSVLDGYDNTNPGRMRNEAWRGVATGLPDLGHSLPKKRALVF
jgi:hypothetical protein